MQRNRTGRQWRRCRGDISQSSSLLEGWLLLTILWIEHLEYQLIHAKIEINHQINAKPGTSHYDFCVKNGWQEYIDTMLAVDFLILNRDRHGANIEVLRNARKRSLRIAPLFDHGLSLLCSCYSEEQIKKFDIMEDKPCQNFIGSRSTLENLNLIQNKASIFKNRLTENDRDIIFKDLQNTLSAEHMDKIWEMIDTRWRYPKENAHRTVVI
jgi:hypothetical protein